MPFEIECFADESKTSRNRRTGEKWHYAGLLAVPVEKKRSVLDRLDGAREGCNSELKSTDLDHLSKRRAAENWVDLILSDWEHRSLFISLLGLNATRLDQASFGGDRFDRIYQRFFRSNLQYACKAFSPADLTVVHRIWHDEGQMKHHDYFPWHAIYRLGDDPAIDFREKEIQFIASDHRGPEGRPESHFLQLIDLFIGLSRQLLDDTSQKESICEVAQKLEPLLHRMMTEPRNPNSRYGHKDKYIVSFFPRRTSYRAGDPAQLYNGKSPFYRRRALLQTERKSGQLHLFSS